MKLQQKDTALMSDFTLRVDVSVIIMQGNKVLLMQRPSHDRNFPLHWGIPGGGYESKDDNLETAGKREVYEEVGISIQNLRLLSNNYHHEDSILFVVFGADYESGEIKIDPLEVAQAGWFDLAGLDGKQFTPTTENLIRGILR